MKFNLKRTALCSLAFGWIALFWGSYDAIMQSIDYDVFGFNSVVHGVIIAADNILGLILLPIFGKLSDRTRSRLGKRSPYIIAGTIVSMIGFSGVCIFASLGKDYLIPFLICLFVTLSAMAAYRSPALALVPDVNPDKFRSKANAVSNIVSVLTTVVAMLYFLVFMKFDGYYAIGGAFVGTTLLMLLWYCVKVREPKLLSDVERENAEAAAAEAAEAEQRRINSELKGENEEAEPSQAQVFSLSHALDVQSFTEDNLLHLPNFDSALSHEYMLAKRQERLLERENPGRSRKKLRDRVEFNRFCILAVVFCFYMTYNALTSNFIKYAEYILGFKQNEAIIPLILAQVAAMVAFPLASVLASKLGRKNTIFIGFLIMIAGFSGSAAFTTPSPGLYVIFMLLGVSFGLVMVNIYPFFLETSPDNKLGQDTGIFSMAMTVAMVVTPILSGTLIDVTGGWFGGGENAGFRILFPYSVLFLVLAAVLTALIKGKRKADGAKRGLEAFDVD